MSQMRLPKKKTKIVCTIGPASGSVPMLSQMIGGGMNVARINFAHGTFDTHRRSIANIRSAARNMGERVAIMGDLPGPKMRIGKLAEEPIMLVRGQRFTLQTTEIAGNQERVSMDFAGLPQAVHPGDSIFMNDGYIQLRVKEVQANEVITEVIVGGELRSFKGVNFPGIDLGISAFTDQDREFLAFAAEQRLDAVSQSFVQRAADVEAVRDTAASHGYHPLVIAKIERAGAVKEIDAILEAADGIMVARGDLGVELPIEEIPSTQKLLIQKALHASKIVITATQMLESMTNNLRPTRAEVTDVANAILDGTDAVMLSGETAVGRYPAPTVQMMARIAHITEERHRGQLGSGRLLAEVIDDGQTTRDELISANIDSMSRTLDPTLVFVPSLSGGTARRVARFRLPQWIIAPCRDEGTCQQLQFTFGIYPVYVPAEEVFASPEERQDYSKRWLGQYGDQGDLVLLIEGSGTLRTQDTRRIDIVEI